MSSTATGGGTGDRRRRYLVAETALKSGKSLRGPILTEEGEEDEEGPQLHRVGLGQPLQLLPHLVEDAQRLLPGVHHSQAALTSGPRGRGGAAELHFRLMLCRTSQS